jgi:hypothetical protein
MLKHALIIAALVFVGVTTQTQAQSVDSVKSEEYLLLGSATRGAGEPMLAVDPVDPQNIVVIAMGSLHRLTPAPVSRSMVNEYHATPFSTIPLLAVTHNGGRTWNTGVLPILGDHRVDGHEGPSARFTRCPDPFAAVSKDGTFFVGCEPRTTVGEDFGGSYMLISKDQGNTWNRPPIPLITSWSQSRFASGLKPRFGGVASPWDRPFVKIDDSTGIIYDQAGGGQTDIDQKPGVYRNQSYITSSTDGGRHFGTIYSWDSKKYPQIVGGGYGVAFGVVAVVYVARSVPAGEHVECPCVVFGVSHNRGESFHYRVIRNLPVPRTDYLPSGAPFGAPHPGWFPGIRPPGELALAADQAKAGHFALLVSTLEGLEVSVTEDYGGTWLPWVMAGQVADTQPAKPWLTYSREGVLGLMWRAIRADGDYGIWSVISRDGGRTFSAPLQVSHALSPMRYPERDDGWFGDDVQDMVIDGGNAYMVWGDSRAGFLGTWFGKVALSAYQSTGGPTGAN